jgi:LysR family hydrogen peroxide-inducible transcriptional activator
VITLRQLRYLDALAANGHFGRAASAMGITQPALSMQIRELEQELGAPLVERTAGGAALTAFGRDVVARGARILASVRELDELARVHGEVLAGPVRLGVIPSIAPFLLPALLATAAERYPKAQIAVRESITAALVDELVAGTLDAIVVSVPLGDDRLEEAAAFDDPFLLAAPAGSPHARRSPALPRLIEADELLLLEDGHCLRDQALTVCRTIDPRRLRSFGATSLATIFHLVAAGQGITLVPEVAVDAGILADRRIAVVRFAGPEPHRTVGIAWRRRSPRERDFRALADLLGDARRRLDRPPALAGKGRRRAG